MRQQPFAQLPVLRLRSIWYHLRHNAYGEPSKYASFTAFCQMTAPLMQHSVHRVACVSSSASTSEECDGSCRVLRNSSSFSTSRSSKSGVYMISFTREVDATR